MYLKNIAFVFFLSVLCLSLQAQHDESGFLYTTKTFPEASPKKITVGTSHGNISVSDVPASQTRVEVYIRSSNYMKKLSKQEIQSKLDEYYSLDISLSGDELKASVRRKKDFNWNNESGLNISFVIYVPRTASSSLRTDHGNINLTGLQGNQDAETDHGDISISKITGKVIGKTDHGNVSVTDCSNDIYAGTDHGDITARNCKGTMKLRTDHGDVSANTVAGELTASTSHGNVDLDDMSCSVNTSTDHGDISMTVVNVTGEISAKNSNGDISIALPTGKALDLDLQGRNVSVNTMQNFNGTKSKDLLNGSINGGGTKISARTNKTVRLSFK